LAPKPGIHGDLEEEEDLEFFLARGMARERGLLGVQLYRGVVDVDMVHVLFFCLNVHPFVMGYYFLFPIGCCAIQTSTRMLGLPN
jgi:hypothetical protein